MQSISVFLVRAKFGIPGEKNADISGTQGVIQIFFGFIYSNKFFGFFGHEIHVFFGSSLGKVSLCQVASLYGYFYDRF